MIDFKDLCAGSLGQAIGTAIESCAENYDLVNSVPQRPRAGFIDEPCTGNR